ncbi:DNA-dependent RNA polymerase subunit epsilon [Bacillus marinisedimentorum]|uniref:DNA-dependent RNA polymerase subunit epsilon n=1 Tax=Bacillus marinisedimentorum TaxID=1821260 RepID=UPI0007DF5780|nr:DNA-directed RNA polymerase subunit epsilon [Bacillus marinisedimentorum]
MIFKVLYQKDKNQVPVRERTNAMYVEADSEREVRQKLAERNHNIEFIQEINGAFLEYEQASENFKLETF